MGPLEDFSGCTLKRDLTKMTLKISQPHIITKTTKGFNKDVKSLMNFNTPATPHKGIVCNQERDTKIYKNLHKRCRSGVGSLL